jgi:hypothetical protein
LSLWIGFKYGGKSKESHRQGGWKMKIEIEISGEELLDCLNNRKYRIPGYLEQELRKAEIKLIEATGKGAGK